MTVQIQESLFVSFRAQGIHLSTGMLPPMREPEAARWLKFFQMLLDEGLCSPRQMKHEDLYGAHGNKLTAEDLGIEP